MTQALRTRAIVFAEKEKAELHENVLLPELGEDGILVSTEYSTISRGTELDLYTGQMHGDQWYPILPGYMPVGIVEQTGPQVKHLKVGDRVVGSNLFSGFDPRYCPAWAGHTQHVVISRTSHAWLGSNRAVRVPDGIPAETAGLAMLAGVAWHGVREKIRPQPGELVLVIGQGVIGNFAAQLCQSLGARVVVADWFANRLEMARANGLVETVLTDPENLKERVLQATDGAAPDAVIEVTGENAPLSAALDVVRRYGRVQAQGMYLDAAPPRLLRKLFDKNLTLSATVGETPEMTAECLGMLAEGKISTHGMLTTIARPQDAGDVYHAVHTRPAEYVTCCFHWM